MDSSQNGTLLNGKLLVKEAAKCYPGDLIVVGGEKSKAVYKLVLLEMGYSEVLSHSLPSTFDTPHIRFFNRCAIC
jgi:hypothetical protein